MKISSLFKPLSFLPALALMYMIYSFSSQPADSSTSTSFYVSKKLVQAVDTIAQKGWDDWEIETHAAQINGIVRKGAHITEYFLLAIAVSFPLYVYGVRGILLMLLAGVICVGYACGDEYHQSMVSGRAATARDVLIDSIGIFFGVILTRLIGWSGRMAITGPAYERRQKKQQQELDAREEELRRREEALRREEIRYRRQRYAPRRQRGGYAPYEADERVRTAGTRPEADVRARAAGTRPETDVRFEELEKGQWKLIAGDAPQDQDRRLMSVSALQARGRRPMHVFAQQARGPRLMHVSARLRPAMQWTTVPGSSAPAMRLMTVPGSTVPRRNSAEWTKRTARRSMREGAFRVRNWQRTAPQTSCRKTCRFPDCSAKNKTGLSTGPTSFIRFIVHKDAGQEILPGISFQVLCDSLSACHRQDAVSALTASLGAMPAHSFRAASSLICVRRIQYAG